LVSAIDEPHSKRLHKFHKGIPNGYRNMQDCATGVVVIDGILDVKPEG
jgi:hypothetical protein